MHPTFSTLVVSGGSFKCAAFVGCFKYLDEIGALEKFKTFVGTSAGAALCFFLALGMKPSEIEEVIGEFLEMQKSYQPDLDTMLNMFFTLGMDTGDLLTCFFKKILKRRTTLDDITFIDFAKRTGRDLVVCACRLNDMTETYFSVDNTPNLSVITALRASVSIPFVFTPVNIKDTLYIDAGLTVNFPISYIKDAHLKDVIGLSIADNTFEKKKDTDMNLLDMLSSMMQSSIRIMNKASQTVPNTKDIHVISIHTGDSSCLDFCYDVNTMQFNVDPKALTGYISIGYDKLKCYIESLPIEDSTQERPGALS